MKHYLNPHQVEVLANLGAEAPCWHDSYTVTFSIGDLLDRLPLTVLYDETHNNKYFADRMILGNDVIYKGLDQFEFTKHEQLIDNLFDCYVWYLTNQSSRCKKN